VCLSQLLDYFLLHGLVQFLCGGGGGSVSTGGGGNPSSLLCGLYAVPISLFQHFHFLSPVLRCCCQAFCYLIAEVGVFSSFILSSVRWDGIFGRGL
jgi:hypothetical protein